MSDSPKILAFAGSTRTDSYNKKLVKVAAEAARQAGAEVMYVDLRDLAMPLYDGDLEASTGIPHNAREFKRLLIAHQGFLIASPEYNSSYSAVLKNAIDWASRPEPGDPALVAFTGKVVALMSASPGNLGGLRGLMQLRSLLSNISVLVLPEQFALSQAHDAFSGDGNLKEASQYEKVKNLSVRLTTILTKLNS